MVAFGYLAHEKQFVAILVEEVEIVDVPTAFIILFLSVVLDNNHEMTVDTAVCLIHLARLRFCIVEQLHHFGEWTAKVFVQLWDGVIVVEPRQTVRDGNFGRSFQLCVLIESCPSESRRVV